MSTPYHSGPAAAGDETTIIPQVTDGQYARPGAARPGEPGYLSYEERARRADGPKMTARVKNWFQTGDGSLSLTSAAGKALGPAVNDGYAITALVTSLCGFGLFGLIFGILSIKEARREHRRTSGMAIGGIAVAIFEFAVVVLVIVILIAVSLAAASAVGTGLNSG